MLTDCNISYEVHKHTLYSLWDLINQEIKLQRK